MALSLLRRLVWGAASTIGDSIEAIGSGEYREDLHLRIRRAAERAAELQAENSLLRRRLGELKDSGPTLWLDEVLVIQELSADLRLRVSTELSIDLELDRRMLAVVDKFLGRCVHLPMTEAQIAKANDAVTSWDDPGTDLDEPCPRCHDSPRPMSPGDGCPACGNHGRDLTGDSW